jgi:hypothetical protein
MMNKEEATRLVDKCMTVILSCETIDQLKTATRYADFIYRKLAREIGLINHTQFIALIERSIGFAQCKVKYNVKA